MKRKHLPLSLELKFRSMRCVICNSWDIEIDHIIPVSLGGTNDESNLQSLCKKCNRIKEGMQRMQRHPITNSEIKTKLIQSGILK
jgi:5-methylcytosine-specific restriction endonuclease McrA